MTPLFVAAGNKTWGSSRLRVYWPAKYMGAQVEVWSDVADELWKYPDLPFDALIFQKRIEADMARRYRDSGILIFWDMCDPAWWWEAELTKEIIYSVTGVVFATEALEQDFTAWAKTNGCLPDNLITRTIPDRIDPQHYTLQREHGDSNPTRFIWYGIAVNRISLYGSMPYLSRLAANGYNIELTIMDDRPGHQDVTTGYFPIYYAPWRLEQENEIIANHDIALLGKYPGPWGKVKSNNRQLTAWACGLPATTGHNYDELLELMNPQFRQSRAWEGQEWLHKAYTSDKSASEWTELLQQCAS